MTNPLRHFHATLRDLGVAFAVGLRALMLFALMCTAGLSPVCSVASEVEASRWLPFVDSAGMLVRPLTRSSVRQLLGEGESATSQSLRYPTLGLRFVIDDSWREPLVEAMHVTAPSTASTIGGLGVGAPTKMALEILERSYRIRERTIDGTHPGSLLRSVHATGRSGSGAGHIEVVFAQGRVASLAFFSEPARRVPSTTATGSRRWSGMHVTIIVVAGLGLLCSILFGDKLHPWGIRGDLAGPIGLGLAVVSGTATALASAWARQQDAVIKLFVFFGAVGALAVGVLGLTLMATSSSRVYAWSARALLAGGVIAMLIVNLAR